MAKLINQKHELFAQKVALGVSQAEAYALVYGASASVPFNASRLRANEKVAERIAELTTAERTRQDRMAEGKRMTADDVVAKLEAMAEDPKTSENGRIKVLELVGKAKGVEGFCPRGVPGETNIAIAVLVPLASGEQPQAIPIEKTR